MPKRYEQVIDAHPTTFKWAFQDLPDGSHRWANLTSLLKNGNGLYLISGKPGSGKSTLMKHIYDNHRTRLYLEKWAQTGQSTPVPLLCPMLKLQDLTVNDIETFVTEKTLVNSAFKKLSEHAPQATSELIQEIVGNEEGVSFGLLSSSLIYGGASGSGQRTGSLEKTRGTSKRPRVTLSPYYVSD
jgi:hypothetical protein